MPSWGNPFKKAAQFYAGPVGWYDMYRDNRGRPEDRISPTRRGRPGGGGGYGSDAYWSGGGDYEERRIHDKKYDHGAFDQSGFTEHMPGFESAPFAQYESDRIIEQRRHAMYRQAQLMRQQQLDTLGSYRPGGLAQLTSPMYENMARGTEQQALNLESPDMMYQTRKADSERAYKRAKKASQQAMMVSAGTQLAGMAVGAIAGGAGGGALGPAIANAAGNVGSSYFQYQAAKSSGTGGQQAFADGAVKGATDVATGKADSASTPQAGQPAASPGQLAPGPAGTPPPSQGPTTPGGAGPGGGPEAGPSGGGGPSPQGGGGPAGQNTGIGADTSPGQQTGIGPDQSMGGMGGPGDVFQGPISYAGQRLGSGLGQGVGADDEIMLDVALSTDHVDRMERDNDVRMMRLDRLMATDDPLALVFDSDAAAIFDPMTDEADMPWEVDYAS